MTNRPCWIETNLQRIFDEAITGGNPPERARALVVAQLQTSQYSHEGIQFYANRFLARHARSAYSTEGDDCIQTQGGTA